MWRVTINCSAESWRLQGSAFKAIAQKYGGKSLSSKKMRDDERRIMEYQIEDVNDAETFMGECMTLPGFTAFFEAL